MFQKASSKLWFVPFVLLTGCEPGSDRVSHDPVVRAPEPVVERPMPPLPRGWRRVPYVFGFSIAVPSEAVVARPQGIDSTILHVSGPGYLIEMDDYGDYKGTGEQRIAGRRAVVEAYQTLDCRETNYEIELPTRVDYLQVCDPSGKRCTSPAGKVRLAQRCVAGGCRTADAIVDTIHFAPPPFAPVPTPDPEWRPKERQICRSREK